jgi:outer membrane protein TolC
MSVFGQLRYTVVPGIIVCFFTAGPALAQTVPLSFKETLEKVQHNLPQLEAMRQQAAAAKENINLVKNTLVPDVTAGYQVNTATYNNITGMSYPGFLLPISGPPSVSNKMDFVPGTALGALIKWNPFTFGQRNAALEKATTQYKQVNASYNEQLFQYQFTAINLYLEALYLKQVTRISQTVIDRYNISFQQSLVLAKNGLKPGIDTAQFQSAIMQAEIELIQTEKAYLQKLVELTRLTGITTAASGILLTDSSFKASLQPGDGAAVNMHPHYQFMEAKKQSTEAGLRELRMAWAPQLDVWANVYARGSGVNANGAVNKAEGWGLSRTNAGIGLQLSFPVLQFSKLNILKKQYHFLLQTDEANLAQARLDIAKQIESAELQYREDAKIAAKTPVQLRIATDVYEGLKLSYEAGLIDYTRLYQSQFELTKAAVNNATAQLQLWRSLLSIAVAKGNLSIFLDQLN